MSILFLDFDGVLNNSKSIKKFGTNQIFDKENIENLNYILTAANPDIVISSNWRLSLSLEEIKNFLYDQKLRNFNIIDITTSYDKIYTPDNIKIPLTREQEILIYLSRTKNNRKFVILDDRDDFGRFMPHLVKTQIDYGLTRELSEQTILLLSKNC